MKARRLTLTLAMLLSTAVACAQAPPADEQVAAAVSAAPEHLRAAATVLGYEGDELVTLREGEGALVCLADDPADDGFHVACYHESLAPFMERGRALRAEGLSGEAVDSTRRAEIEAGTLTMPDHPAALYSLSGEAGSFDAATGTASEARALHVVYVPYATEEETGLPPSGGPGVPWLMEPGTPWAHIMVAQPNTAASEDG